MQRGARLSAAAAVLALLGCTGQDAPPPTPSQAAPSSPSAPAAAPSGTVVETEVDGVPVRLVVGPVVRDGELAVLRMSAEVTAGTDELLPGDAFGFVFRDIGRVAPNNLRLVDAERLTVSLTAETPDGTEAVERNKTAEPGKGPVAFHPVFAAPEGDDVAVLVPLVGLVPDVPVVEAGSPEAASVARTVADTAAEVDATPAQLRAEVRDLESFRELDSGAVRSRESQEQVAVAVDSDVLFAVDQDVLSPEADATLRSALERITSYRDGALSVVGHTDDVADDAYNQGLSERRAAAVSARLGQLSDLSPYDVTVAGKGETQPAVEGTGEQARALNRRVELLFTASGPPASTEAADEPGNGTAPEPSGPAGTGPAGIEVRRSDEPDVVRVRLAEVREVGGVLVGTLEVEPVSDDLGTVAWLVAGGAIDPRGEFAPNLQFAASRVTLLDGADRVYALDYVLDDDSGREPLADLILNDDLDPGETMRITVVWPAIDADQVIVDVPPLRSKDGQVVGGNPWRLTDVPVR